MQVSGPAEKIRSIWISVFEFRIWEKEGGSGKQAASILRGSDAPGYRVVLTRDRWRQIVRQKHSVWFDDPQKEHVCEEADDDMVRVKDRKGRVIGLERLNALSAKQRKEGAGIPVEVQMG